MTVVHLETLSSLSPSKVFSSFLSGDVATDGRRDIEGEAVNLNGSLHVLRIDKDIIDIATYILGHTLGYPIVNYGDNIHEDTSNECLVVSCVCLVYDQIRADLEAPGLETCGADGIFPVYNFGDGCRVVDVGNHLIHRVRDNDDLV